MTLRRFSRILRNETVDPALGPSVAPCACRCMPIRTSVVRRFDEISRKPTNYSDRNRSHASRSSGAQDILDADHGGALRPIAEGDGGDGDVEAASLRFLRPGAQAI